MPSVIERPVQGSRSLPPFPRYLVREHLELLVLVWAGLLAFTFAVTLGVSYWRDIEVSGWSIASQVAPWYALFIGVHVGHSVLPLHITHGQTRREYFAQAVMFVGVFAAAVAVLVAVGFVVEAGLYRLAGWPQTIEDASLYERALQSHLVIAETWLIAGLWAAGGAFIGAAFYRDGALGFLAIVASVFIAGIAGLALGSDWGPFGGAQSWTRWIGDDPAIQPLAGAVIYLVCIAVALALLRLVTRDVPVRNKSA
jgi:hypothetical protein